MKKPPDPRLDDAGKNDWQRARARLQRAVSAGDEVQRLSPERVRAILEERARNAARVPPQPPAADTIIEVVLFDLGAERYAIETRHVREILRGKHITPLPGAPEFVIGVSNLRGQILAIFDLRPFFGITASADTESTRIIVLGDKRMEFGFLADTVHEVKTLRKDELHEAPESLDAAVRAFLRGVTADALIVLDGAVLLSDPRLHVDLGDDKALPPRSRTGSSETQT